EVVVEAGTERSGGRVRGGGGGGRARAADGRRQGRGAHEGNWGDGRPWLGGRTGARRHRTSICGGRSVRHAARKQKRCNQAMAHGVVLPHRWPPTPFEGKEGAMHPILIRIPLPGWKFLGELHSIPIHSYGVMLGLSLVVGWYLTLGLAERDKLPKETLANCYV